ncbi:hypothetical protein ACU4GD_00065 [Cupriavidus basilensis]
MSDSTYIGGESALTREGVGMQIAQSVEQGGVAQADRVEGRRTAARRPALGSRPEMDSTSCSRSAISSSSPSLAIPLAIGRERAKAGVGAAATWASSRSGWCFSSVTSQAEDPNSMRSMAWVPWPMCCAT